ncbi:MAG: hypothetical protein J6Q58_04010 [Clostridia bacterium]|nr:hypothetical protein [Clostridia bacterium]
MNKTIKRNVLVSAILAIMLCVSLIAGATFALFTSESKVNIAVTSGKVSVVANIDETSVQTKQLYDTQYEDGKGNMFMGEDVVATFTAAGLELNNVVPGDGIKFNIVVKNESTVSVKYRTIISCENDNGLFAGLNITVGNNENYSGVTLVSNWAQLAVGSADEIVPVTIELPEGAGNEYQDKTCTISYKVEAVQGNATVENQEDGVLYIWNAFDLKNFRDAVNSGTSFSGKTVKLAANVDLNNEEWTPIGTWDNTFDGTFDGQGFVISNLYINAPETEDVALFGVATSATFKDINVNNVNVTGYNKAATIVATPYTGCSIYNCHVTGDVNIVSEYAYAGGIASYGYIKAIDNCSVIPTGVGTIKAKDRNAVGGIMAWTLEDTNGIISNCIVKDLELTGWANIGSIVGFVHRTNSIVDCTAENIVITKTRDGGNATLGYVAGGWSYTAGKKITISNNTIKNVELNGNYVANEAYLKGINAMFGAEYAGNANADTSVFVMENNVLENVTDNRTCRVTTAEALISILSNPSASGVIDATDVTVTITNNVNFEISASDVTIKGATLATSSRGGDYIVAKGTGTITFEDCIFGRAETGMIIIAANDANGADLVFNNCNFNGPVAPNFVEKADGKSQFNNCTFTVGTAFIKQGWVNCMGGTHTFTNCTFDYTGGSTNGSNQYVKYNAVNSYSESYSTAVILEGCTRINCSTQKYGSNSTLTVK